MRAEGVEGRAPILRPAQRPRFDEGDEVPRRPAALACATAASRRSWSTSREPARRCVSRSSPPSTIAEIWASRIVDWLETREDVDPGRIGREGVSLGGYTAPARWPSNRVSPAASPGRNHDWRDVQKKRLARAGELPCAALLGPCSLGLGRARHGRVHAHRRKRPSRRRARPNQGPLSRHARREGLAIPLHWAHRTYEQLVNSPKRELKIFARARRRRAAFELRQFRPNAGALYRRLGRRNARRPHRLIRL